MDLPRDRRFGDLGSRVRANASGWIAENQGYHIFTRDLDGLARARTPSFHERADKLLMAVQERTEYAGALVPLSPDFLARAWALNEAEMGEIVRYLHDQDLVWWSEENPVLGSAVMIKPAGWAHLEKLKEANPDSIQGFIAMWFSDQVEDAHRAIRDAIQAAGYLPVRVDDREHEGRIDDRIIAEIRRSRFIVADFTGHRGGVYYEAGFAHGLKLPVFFTCRKDDLANLHFDIRQYNCLEWETAEELRDRLRNRIAAVLGQGAH